MLEIDRRWLLIAALCLGGCSDPAREGGTDTGTDTGADTGKTDGGDTGTGDTGTVDTGASDADGGETAPLVAPTSGMAIVPGGVRMTGDNHILVTTTTGMSGGFASSSAFVLHGGVVGAVESSR